MAHSKTNIKPRKKPVQSRSGHTVDAIFDATIQVLLTLGPDKLTTTKVADRAGVSVGTLYQYFGDKRSLLHAVLERHLLVVTTAVEQACLVNRGLALEDTVAALVKAFVAAKFAHPETSRALYRVAPDVEGQQMVANLMQRGQAAICGLLADARDVYFEDPITVALVLSSAMTGPVQALLELDAPPSYRDKLEQHLNQLALGYLRSVALLPGVAFVKS